MFISVNSQFINPNLNFNHDNFKLGCTPIINLYTKVTEPIKLHHRHYRYRMVPSYRRENISEIHTITKVITATEAQEEAVTVEPFFSAAANAPDSHTNLFWYAERMPAKCGVGSDVYVSFVDLHFNPQVPPQQIAYAHTLATNRELATHIPPNGKLMSDITMPVKSIVCLNRPSAPIDPPRSGEMQWRLISHLSAKYLGFNKADKLNKNAREANDPAGQDNAACMRDLLMLYADITQNRHVNNINQLHKIIATPTVGRVGGDAWRGFVMGQALELWFKPTSNDGDSLLLGKVLHHFLQSQTAINSFVQSTIFNYRYKQPMLHLARGVGKPLPE